MSETEIVKKKMKENREAIASWNLNAIMCENAIKTIDSQKEHQSKLYKDVMNKLDDAQARAFKNAKTSHKKLEGLITEKESLHEELKAAIHVNETKCEYCNNYYTSQGYSRHKSNCSFRPEAIIIEKSQKTLDVDKENLLKQKVEIERKIAEAKKNGT